MVSLFQSMGLLQPNPIAGGLKKSADGFEYAVVDGVVGAQGPNYALAKRMQVPSIAHTRWICVRGESLLQLYAKR